MVERRRPPSTTHPKPPARRAPIVGLVIGAIAVAAVLVAMPAAQGPRAGEPIAPLSYDTGVDGRVAALGERLFHDVRLSLRFEQSCATCHPLDRGGTDGLPTAAIPGGSRHARNTPTVFNVGLNASYNWDGAFETLEAHTDKVIETLMGVRWDQLLARLRRDQAYATGFRNLFGDGPTKARVLGAIAAFERSLVTPSPFDRYLRGERAALSPAAVEGYELFKSYGCASCHQGVNVGGNVFQKFGVFAHVRDSASPHADRGRARVTGAPRDEQVFRVPSLRNVAVTAPYFHDGRERQLDSAVATMARAQLGRELSRAQIERIVDFLRTLTGTYRGEPLAGFAMER
jgi:cytochrome c peroxidase